MFLQAFAPLPGSPRPAAEALFLAGPMNEHDRAEHLRAYQSIERRLALFVPNAASTSRPPSWRRRFRPQLWQTHQYSSRRLRIRSHYTSDKAPNAPPRIAIVTPSLNQGRFIAAS